MCMVCGLPFASPRVLDFVDVQCGACRDQGPAFDLARCFGLYGGALRQAILRMKFGGDERLAERMGELLLPPWQSLGAGREFRAPLLVPVPLHPSRLRERGFNQAEWLARGVERAIARRGAFALPRLRTNCLGRKRATPPQTGMSLAARRENLRGAFDVTDLLAVHGREIVLVDDVMTTGATLSACARVLKRAGAGQVMAIALARATPQFPDLAPFAEGAPVD